MSVTGFERLGTKFGIGICGCALVFGESFRHFKTTVTDWHILIFDFRCRLPIWKRVTPGWRKAPINRKSAILNLQFLIAGFPLASAASHPATETRTNGVISKTRCEGWNKCRIHDFANDSW